MNTQREKGRERVKKLTSWTTLLLILTVLLGAGCVAPTGGPQTPTQEARKPFSARTESEDGAIVAWSSYTEGYEPGAEVEFDITIKNETDQTWRGRYCLQLLARHSHEVIVTLEQRAFTLEPGVGFSDTITARLPADLDEGGYGLSLAVRRPGGPMVDLVPIQIGETDAVRRPTTQQDMDASLEACPPVEEAQAGAEPLVKLAKADLAQRLGLSPHENEIEVQSIEETEFPDTSLGVPEPGKTYAQVITPGYVIELAAAGQTYRYHASGERVVAVPAPAEEEGSPGGDIAIEGVTVSDAQVVVHGKSTLPEGACVSTELWADGVPLPWWPVDACAPVRQGTWELVVPLEAGQALQPSVQYVVRAYQPGGPNIVATFPFDLDAPPAPEEDPVLLLPESAEPLHRASADLDDDGSLEEVVLTGWGGSADRLGYDFLQAFVIASLQPGEHFIAWQSEQLPTERAEPLRVQDVNGDSLLEVLSVQAMGASGETLYLLGRQDEGYDWLVPHGGHFEGETSFGESGVRVEDIDGDGFSEILADYGPASQHTDVYAWDGEVYVYQETLDHAEGTRVEGWTGSIYKLPPGNQFGQYMMRDDGERFGVSASSDAIRQQINEAMWSGAQIKVWGTLHHGVPATEARQIEVDRLEVLSEAAPEPRYLSPFASVSASSHLPSDSYGQYFPYAAIDGSLETAWAEGVSGPGIGEWIQLTFPGAIEIHAIDLAIGYDKNEDTFAKNNRLKQATLVFSNGERMTIDFEDARGLQQVSLPETLGSTIEADAVKVVIDAVYPGTKYDDTCLAEIEVYGVTK